MPLCAFVQLHVRGLGPLFSPERVGEAASPKMGGLSTPIPLVDTPPQGSSPGTAVAGPSCSKLWPQGRLPGSPSPLCQHLWRQRVRAQACGPLGRTRGHP